MRYRRRRLKTDIELFPFLSILACTIGTLILLIIVISTQAFGDQKEIRIIAKVDAGQNLSKTPRYIEVTGEGVIIHPEKTLVQQAELQAPYSALTDLIEQVSTARDREYLIVAVRPEGIAIFDEVRSKIEAKGIDIGYEPIDSDWILKIEVPEEPPTP
ncbi:MAG: hypothetical protein AAGG02_13080 [Cyanobacteria bacterium P01_H01_bin.15]